METREKEKAKLREGKEAVMGLQGGRRGEKEADRVPLLSVYLSFTCPWLVLKKHGPVGLEAHWMLAEPLSLVGPRSDLGRRNKVAKMAEIFPQIEERVRPQLSMG